MKNQKWQLVGMLAIVILVYFTGEALAEEAGADAGTEKESMLDLIKKGGLIMIPLALGSILALALGIERFISLSTERVLPAGFIDSLMKAWKSDPSGKRAIAYCDESGGAAGHIFKAGVRRAKMGSEAVEKAIEDAGSREADKMKRSLRPISVVATVSPLLGLLGTVYGMIGAFQATAGAGNAAAKPEMLATGIYEALVTTAAGLTIAIPVLLLYQFLLGRVDKVIDHIDEAGTEFVFTYTDGQPDGPATAGSFGGSATEKSDSSAATIATAGA
jgi:biopolymer transport protein ExbB